MSRRRLHAIRLTVLALLVGTAGGGWWYMAVGRYPLRGDYHHDFGDVPIAGRSASVSHTFTLTNVRSEPVVIRSLGKGCGCTDVRASTMTVEPGGTVDIEITLNLGKAGKKRTDVTMVLEDFGIQKLWFKAVGRKEIALSKNHYQIDLVEGQTTPVSFFASLQATDEAPETPIFQIPENLTVEFVGWQLVEERDRTEQRAARWRGRMQVTLEKDELPDLAQLILRVRDVPLVFELVTPNTKEKARPGTRGAGSVSGSAETPVSAPE
jgi:hypothetical protein